MRVCIFIGNIKATGGIGRVASLLANGLVEMGLEVYLMSFFEDPAPNVYWVDPKVKQPTLLDEPQSMAKTMLKGGPRKLRLFLEENQIDYLVASGALFFPLCINACFGTGVKCICWEHSDPNGKHDHNFQMVSRKYGARRAWKNVVLTDAAYKTYTGNMRASETVKIPNPIDPAIDSHFDGYSSGAKRIITVGRLSYQKNIESAIEVASRVLPANPDWIWDVYGEGDLKENLEGLIKDKSLEGRFNLKGRTDALYELYKDYSILVMTSRYEGFPMALLEGTGFLLPLVSYDVPTGPSEVIEDGVNGYLIPFGDEERMAERLNLLLASEQLRIRFSDASRSKKGEYGIDRFIASWIDVLKGCEGQS